MRRDPAYPDMAPVWGAPSMPLMACHTPLVSVWPDSPLAQLQAPASILPPAAADRGRVGSPLPLYPP